MARAVRNREDFVRPFVGWSRLRMPMRGLAWHLGWWLILRVTLRDYSGPQRARMVRDALGPFQVRPPGVVVTSASNVTIKDSQCRLFERWAAEHGLPPVEPVPAWWAWTPPLPGTEKL